MVLQTLIKVSSDIFFYVASWFPGNGRVKPHFNTQCPPPHTQHGAHGVPNRDVSSNEIGWCILSISYFQFSLNSLLKRDGSRLEKDNIDYRGSSNHQILFFNKYSKEKEVKPFIYITIPSKNRKKWLMITIRS